MNLGDSSISAGGHGFISESSVDELYDIFGVAIGSNDVTRGSTSGERKMWLPEVLEDSAETLQGKQLVVDHENRSSRDVVGEITEARFEDGVGVIYQGVLDDAQLASKIDHGWLEVSPRIIHSNEFEDLEDVKVPQEIYRFDNLSIVSKGAAKSNEINLGEHEQLAEELQSAFESEGVAEYQQRLDELQVLDGDIQQYLYDNPEGAQGASQGLNCSGFHETTINGEKRYMPCNSRDDFIKNLKRKRVSEMAKFNQDDFVEWNNGSAHGQIIEWTNDGTFNSRIDGDISVSGTEDDPAALIQIYQEEENGWAGTDTTVAHKFSTLNEWNPSSFAQNSAVEEMAFKEEKSRIASQMSSHSKLTKSESMGLLEAINPNENTDLTMLSKALATALGEHEDEMFQMMDEFVNGEGGGRGSDDSRSGLRRVFGMSGLSE